MTVDFTGIGRSWSMYHQDNAITMARINNLTNFDGHTRETLEMVLDAHMVLRDRLMEAIGTLGLYCMKATFDEILAGVRYKEPGNTR